MPKFLKSPPDTIRTINRSVDFCISFPWEKPYLIVIYAYLQPLSLRHLIVDHNPLGNGAIEQLVQIMKALQNLRVLSIVDCNLTAGFFSKNKRELANAMQGKF